MRNLSCIATILLLYLLSKSNFCNKYFRDNVNNISKVWEGIKSNISIKYYEFCSPTCLNIDNCPVTDLLSFQTPSMSILLLLLRKLERKYLKCQNISPHSLRILFLTQYFFHQLMHLKSQIVYPLLISVNPLVSWYSS